MKLNGKSIIILIAVICLFIGVVSSCGGSSKSDIAYDPDGFLGYSDSFWEWYEKNN